MESKSAVDDAKIQELVRGLGTGQDQIIIDALITEHTPMVRLMCNAYASHVNRTVREDARGNGYLALVEAVQKWCRENTIKAPITPYVGIRVRGGVINSIRNDHTIHIPGNLLREKDEEGNCIHEFPALIRIRNTQEGDKGIEASLGEDYHPDDEIQEVLDDLHMTFDQQAVAVYRIAGFSIDDISEIMGKSRPWVSLKIKEIKEKLSDHLPTESEHECMVCGKVFPPKIKMDYICPKCIHAKDKNRKRSSV